MPRRTPATPGTGGSTAALSTPRRCAIACSTSPAASIDPGPVRIRSRPLSAWHFTAHHQFKAVYASDHRSVYLMVQRLHPHPYLALFNGPDTSLSTAVRERHSSRCRPSSSSTARSCTSRPARFARSLIARQSDSTSRVRFAYLRAYGRRRRRRNRTARRTTSGAYDQLLAEEGIPAERRSIECWSSLARTILASNEFLYVD